MNGRTSICTLSIVRCGLVQYRAWGAASCEGPVPFALLQTVAELRDTLARLARLAGWAGGRGLIAPRRSSPCTSPYKPGPQLSRPCANLWRACSLALFHLVEGYSYRRLPRQPRRFTISAPHPVPSLSCDSLQPTSPPLTLQSNRLRHQYQYSLVLQDQMFVPSRCYILPAREAAMDSSLSRIFPSLYNSCHYLS
jgi:hypothetical protein